MASRLLFYKPQVAIPRQADVEEDIMDWTLLIIGTLTALLGVLSIYLIWREKNHTSQRHGGAPSHM
jgi:hypothetical protein